MALVTRKALFDTFSPLVQAKRFRGKINIQRPRAPHFVKATYLAAVKPYFIHPDKDKTLTELCTGPGKFVAPEEDNPYQRILARELREMFVKSRLVGFYHVNPFPGQDRARATVMFKKENMVFKEYGKKTLEIAVKNTPYEAVLDFFVSRNMMVFSPEPEIKTLLKITKKFAPMILLAGIYEGKFCSKDELLKYSLIPNLQTAQADLVQTLNSVGSQLVSHLNCHQTTLVSNLQERIKQLEENENKT